MISVSVYADNAVSAADWLLRDCSVIYYVYLRSFICIFTAYLLLLIINY